MTTDLQLEGATREVAALARQVTKPPDEGALDEALGRVQARLERHRASRGRRGSVWGVVLVAAAALVLVTWRIAGLTKKPLPLAYRAEGAELLGEGYIRARPGEHPRVSFSEGSVVALADDTRVRVVAADEHGGHLAIEEGEVRADIVHRAGARWTFEAGPYSVDVRGTSFSLDWRGADGLFDLRLQTGLLDIHTPWSPAPIALHGGQRLTVRSADHEVTIRDLDDPSAPAGGLAASAAPAPQAAPDSVSGRVAGDGPAVAEPPKIAMGNPKASPKQHRASWSETMASGDLQSIVDDALEHGVEATVMERTSEELAVLEASARYRKRPDIARRALLAQRARFAGSPRAKEAAFLLGRMVESADGPDALAWYERYLSEDPGGAFAAEATGRDMIVTHRLFGVGRARPLAEAYLKRWPTGAYSDLARSILNGS
jgi:FecR protein